ncbi:hypothetical protein KDA08_02430 [Candidatus Saccharibacteria bacterium]|nr:hypothetical protein [Candidatus Saccharibacteria bacterium]
MKYLLLLLSLNAYSQTARYFDVWRSQSSNDYVTVRLNEARIGDGTNSVDKKISANNGDINLPFIGYDESANAWILSNDGTTTGTVATGAIAYSSSSILNLGLAASVGSNALTIAVKGADGNDPSSTNQVIVSFRNTTAANGLFSTVAITGALSMTVSSGSELGHPATEEAPIYIYLINNAGTAEVAVSTAYFDEGVVHSTTAEGGAGGADSNAVLYSTTARSNVAIRLVGMALSTQTVSGTWAAVPTQLSVHPFVRYGVRGQYSSNSGAAVSNGANYLFEDVGEDTVGLYNPSTGVATLNEDGDYIINVQIRSNANASVFLAIEYNGSEVAVSGDVQDSGTDTTTNPIQLVYYLVNATAGSTIEIVNNTGTSVTLASDGTMNRLSIVKISR